MHAKAQPFKVVLPLRRNIFADSPHEHVLRFEADVRFIGLILHEPERLEESDQHATILLRRFFRAIQIPGPGIPAHIHDLVFHERVVQQHREDAFGQALGAPGAAGLDRLDLHHDPRFEFGPALSCFRIGQHPESDD